MENEGLNPYFIGLSILIIYNSEVHRLDDVSQSLFYWIIYSYFIVGVTTPLGDYCLNPYFIGLSILIRYISDFRKSSRISLNPYFIGLSILIACFKNSRNGYSKSQSLFYWIIYSYKLLQLVLVYIY